MTESGVIRLPVGSLDGMSNEIAPPPRPMSEAEQLANWFSYHPPLPGQAESYERIRAAARVFAEVLVRECPASADRTVAVRHVRDAVFSANASIACGGK